MNNPYLNCLHAQAQIALSALLSASPPGITLADWKEVVSTQLTTMAMKLDEIMERNNNYESDCEPLEALMRIKDLLITLRELKEDKRHELRLFEQVIDSFINRFKHGEKDVT
jgi:hypothetical protein